MDFLLLYVLIGIIYYFYTQTRDHLSFQFGFFLNVVGFWPIYVIGDIVN